MMWQELIYNIYSSKINIDENTVNNELNNQLIKKSSVKEFKISNKYHLVWMKQMKKILKM